MQDNRIFNVNGIGDDFLKATLELALNGSYPIKGYWVSDDHGMVLTWGGDKSTKFPSPLKPSEVFPIVKAWLGSAEAQSVKTEGWDAKCDTDGDLEMGWRVYCEGWGHVNHDTYSLIAIKPAYMWYGK